MNKKVASILIVFTSINVVLLIFQPFISLLFHELSSPTQQNALTFSFAVKVRDWQDQQDLATYFSAIELLRIINEAFVFSATLSNFTNFQYLELNLS